MTSVDVREVREMLQRQALRAGTMGRRRIGVRADRLADVLSKADAAIGQLMAQTDDAQKAENNERTLCAETSDVTKRGPWLGTEEARLLSARLHSMRRARKLTQLELADKAGTSNAQISKYEAGVQKPGEQMVRRLAAALGCSTEWLLGRGKDAETDV